MAGLYQLFILAVVSSVVSAEEVKTTKYSQPFPLDMPVSQTCKEKAQAKCNGTCGWAECVATYLGPLLDFPVAVRKKPLPPLPDFALNAECCPAGHEFRCCEMPENTKYTWVKKNANEMIKALDEKPECKPTKAQDFESSGTSLYIPSFEKYYCACEFSSYHRMMDGMCCSKNNDCGCCSTDPIISKLPRLLYAPKKFGEEEGKECGGTTKTCKRNEGWPVSSCCGAGYHLVEGDERFVSIQTAGLRITGLPTLETVLLAPRPVAYAYQWRTSKPHTMHIAGFSADRYMGNPIIWKPATITYTIPAVNEELLDSYWVPRVVPPGTGDLV